MTGWPKGRTVDRTAKDQPPHETDPVSDEPYCPFCERVNEPTDLPRNRFGAVIYDAHPRARGHLLVVPYVHVADYFDLRPDVQAGLWDLVTQAHDYQLARLGPDGWTVRINVGTAAGQTIPHVHVHVLDSYGSKPSDPFKHQGAAVASTPRAGLSPDKSQVLANQSDLPWSGRHLHFVGIGGCGMSGLALLASHLGADVTGSDQKESIFTASLRTDPSIAFSVGHDAKNVPAAAEVVYSSAIREDNVERAQGRSRGHVELHRSGLIAQLTQVRRTIAVAGAHGKTTTSALLAHVLTEGGLDPSYIVGGLMRPPGAHARAGHSDLLVIEADESDRSLLNYDVDLAIITNIDLDHVGDAGGFTSRTDVVDLLRRFAVGAETLITTADSAEELGMADSAIVPSPTAAGDEFVLGGNAYKVNLPGDHNVHNACLVVAAALQLGCSPDEIARSLASFPGLKRRFELRGTTNAGARVFDDYAHHPSEVAAAIQAARTLTSGPVVAVFQPHLFSRTRQFSAEFAEALATADIALLDNIYPARETQDAFPDITSSTIVANAPAESLVLHPGSEEGILEFIREHATGPDSIVLLLGAGDIGRLAGQLIKLPSS